MSKNSETFSIFSNPSYYFRRVSFHTTVTTHLLVSSSNVDYEVSVFHTEQGNKYQFNSSGEVAQTIELVSGQTYTFSLASSALNHPFKFSETSDGVHAGGFHITME